MTSMYRNMGVSYSTMPGSFTAQ